MPVVGWRSRLLSWKHRIRPQTYSCSQQICLEGGQGENCTVQKTLKLAFVVEFTSRKFFHISHGCIKAVKVELFQFAFCSLQYGLKSYFCKYYLSNALYHGGTAGVGITTVYLHIYHLSNALDIFTVYFGITTSVQIISPTIWRADICV